MITEDEFSNQVTNFTVGQSSLALSNESAPPAEEQVPNTEGVQVAGLGTRLGNVFRKLTARSSDDIMKAHNESRSTPPSMPIEDVEAALDAYNGSGAAPISEENISSILNDIGSSDDLTKLLDVAGNSEEKITKQTFEDIHESSDVFKDLAPIFKGGQRGLFTAKQQYGMRRLMNTTGERAVTLARQISEGDHTPELLLEYKQTFSAFESLNQLAKGNARETARALNQQKMIAQTLGNKSLREMQDAMQLLGADSQGNGIISSADNLIARVDGGNTAIESMAYVSNKKLNLYTRGAVELWKNNILSGLGTHVTNISSVAVTNMWENTVIKPTAWAIGKVRTGALGKPDGDRIQSQEFIAQTMGAYVGLRSSFSMFMDAFKSGESKFGQAGKMEDTGAIRQIANQLTNGSEKGKMFADASTISFRLLQAEDDAMRGAVFTQDLYALAGRMAAKENLTGKKWLERTNEILDNPPDDMYEEAIQSAKRKTFTDGDLKGAIGMIANTTKQLTGHLPALQFIMPFVNTPANLIQYSMDTSILSVASPRLWKEIMEGGAKADMASAKMVVGTGLTVSLFNLYQAGLLSGNGPDDFAHRQMLEKEGWKANSVKINGKWISIKKMEPFSTAMGFAIGTLEKVKYAPSEEVARHHMAYAMVSLAETALDSSWMGNLNDFMEAINNPAKWKNFQSNFISSAIVPYSAAIRTLEQVGEPNAAKVSNDTRVDKGWMDLAAERAMTNIPGLSGKLRPARYWDGERIEPTQGNLAFAASPFKTGQEGDGDLANREMLRNGVIAQPPDSVITIGSTVFSLLDITGGEDYLYDQYIVSVGEARREILDDMVNSSEYAELEEGKNSQRYVLLQRALHAAKKVGLIKFLEEDYILAIESDPIVYGRSEQFFLADPIEFVESLVEDIKSFDLNVQQKMTPTREPYELPNDQTYVPRL